MSRLNSAISIVLVGFLVFHIHAYAIPLKNRAVRDVVLADFNNLMTGRFTWTDIYGGEKLRTLGQFNTGLDSTDIRNYQFTLEDPESKAVALDLTGPFSRHTKVNVPGASAFIKDYPGLKSSQVAGLDFVVRKDGEVLDSAGIVAV